jgi:anti-sigma regulatory factor (Ser/Thr protein kinase)
VGAPADVAAGRLLHLQRLSADLAEAMTPDDVARVVLPSALQISHVVRAGLAVVRGAGRRLDFVASDADAVSSAGVRWCHIDGVADVPLAEAARTGDPVYLTSLAELARRFPGMAERQGALGTRGMAALPLVSGGQTLGGLLLSFAVPRVFTADDTAFFETFAAQVAQALRRGLAYQSQHMTSERLQRSLLPESLPDLDGMSLGAHYRPGGLGVDVGGDWYDVIALPDGSVVVVLGDVMGKGVPAAIVMGQIRSALRAYAVLDPSPGRVLERLNRFVGSLGVPEQVVTVSLGLVSPARDTMRLALAGHPAPLLVPSHGPTDMLPARSGPLLGLDSGAWPETRVGLDVETTVLFFSDGLVETRRVGYAEGLRALRGSIAAVEPRRRRPRDLCALLGEVVPDGLARDDVTMLALQPVARGRLLSAGAAFPADASATPQARRFAVRHLTDWGLGEELVETAQLCLSELVTNAVIHTETAPKVSLRLDEHRLLVVVQDEGGVGVARPFGAPDPLDVAGRGLTLVDALTTSWSVERGANGTTVWFELDLA